MNKKQMIFVSAVAAIPAAGLLVILILALLQGMLRDGATVSLVLWMVWTLAVLGCLVIAFIPFAIAFYPGLLPEPAAAGTGAGDSSIADSSAAIPKQRASPVDDNEEGEQEFDDATSDADDGEQLFEDGALDDDFDDDFGGGFDDEEEKPKKRR